MSTISIEDEKRVVVDNYLKDCGTTLQDLKEKIAKESIDYTGTLEGNHSLLLRILRWRIEISTEYYQRGEDGYNDHERFWFEFSMYYHRDVPDNLTEYEDFKQEFEAFVDQLYYWISEVK